MDRCNSASAVKLLGVDDTYNKKQLVRTLVYRVQKLCTHDQLQEEEEPIKRTSLANIYPENFIKQYPKQRMLYKNRSP